MHGPPLVFVYTGGNLPSYTDKSLTLSLELNALQHVLVSDVSRPPWLPGEVDFVDSREFGQVDPEQLVGNGFRYPLDFRNGFWVRTIERFHVLNQWSEATQQSAFVHSELDNLCFGLEDSLPGLDKVGGFAVPREAQSQAVASLVFVNSFHPDPFGNLLNFIRSNSGIGNEMELIASYLDSGKNVDGVALPTIAEFAQGPGSLDRRTFAWNSLVADDFGGVFDAAAVGRWLLGVDPRNRGGRAIKNMEEHPRSDGSPSAFKYSISAGRLTIESFETGEEIRLFNLHVHSKIFHRLSRSYFISRVLKRVNNEIPTVIKPATVRRIALEAKRWVKYLFSTSFVRRWLCVGRGQFRGPSPRKSRT